VTGGLYNAEFVFWIKDLSAPDPYFILPILSVVLLVVQQLLTPSTVKNTSQKVMIYSMPVIFGLMMLFLPSGLCLYMIVSSGIGMVQSFYVRRVIAREEAEEEEEKKNDTIIENLGSKERRAAKRREEKV
jgi:membrane protein insertase Oxa1/YidC/SpoIIIJ